MFIIKHKCYDHNITMSAINKQSEFRSFALSKTIEI